jgi:hypothetical protein
MRTSVVALALAVTCMVAPAALASVHLGASCDGDLVTCHVQIFNADYDWQGVIVQWSYGNLCDAMAYPLPLDPLPLPAVYQEATYTLTFPPPDPDEWIIYRAYYLDPGGALHPAPPYGDLLAHAWSACGDPVLSRGRLTGDPTNVALEVCPQTCWFPHPVPVVAVDVSQLDPGSFETFLGADVVVDVRGQAWLSGMPIGKQIIATQITQAADDLCGPAVPAHPASWGTIKSMYR